MVDHVGIKVKDLARAKSFYAEALRPLGYELVKEIGPELGAGYVGAGFGVGGKPDFWIGAATSGQPSAVHVAFGVADKKSVEAFHAAAIAAGGKDNGLPGPRPQYHPRYYGAFVLDPEGNNIEVVCHQG